MSISSEHPQLQRQLYLLGYSQPLPVEASELVSVLLRDMQTALDRVKELEKEHTRLERDERVGRAAVEKSRGELHVLRTENNSLRSEILTLTREADKIRHEARGETYKWNKTIDDLRMSNLCLRAEGAESARKLDECQKRLEELISQKDPIPRLPRLSVSRPLDESLLRSTRVNVKMPPAPVIDLVDLSSRRITALEEEIDILESKLSQAKAEMKASEMDVKDRDLEIIRLNAQIEKSKPQRSAAIGDDSTEKERLEDQMEYMHEQNEALERQVKEQKEQFAREKDELHRRWVAAENERVRLSEQHQIPSAKPATPPLSAPSSAPPHMQAQSPELERLRSECANIKSLYAQTRDQLQELLKSGNAENRRLQQEAQNTESTLRQELDQLRNSSSAETARLRASLDKMPEYQRLAESREKQIQQLEQRLHSLSESLESTRQAHAKESDRLQQKLRDAQQRQGQIDTTLEEYKQLVEQHKKLDRSLKQAVGEVAEWRAKYDERDHKLSDLTRKVDEYRMSYKQSSSELRTCKRTLDAYGNDLASLREANEHLQRENERMRQEIEQLGRLKQAIEMSKDDYKRQLAKALSENEKHRSLVAHLQGERASLRVQVKAQFHLNQRLEQRLESVDPAYVVTGVNTEEPSTSVSYLDSHRLHRSATNLPTEGRRPQVLSRSSSAAHSTRSFEPRGYVDNELESTSSVSIP
ncbi:hypothetical protein GGI15_003141 [Coemansia interrupta]|uniref:Uncharacterized protein n=1 Tax=Coemansia interrupta TaxID=1126814 RepID=A0A9W8LJH7_9FUNG|nr:hypothetical protein GGI15_003141 [Coemansia interrupta]